MIHFDNSLFLPELLKEYDRLSHAGNFPAAGEFLRTILARAEAAGNRSVQLTILSEMMGLYRMAGDHANAIKAVDKGLTLLEKLDIADPVSGATILINAATALQAAGEVDRALPLYRQAENIYRAKLAADDPLQAGLFNNMAAAYGEKGDFESAEKCYFQALDILQNCEKNLDAAVTYVNLARLYAPRDEVMSGTFLDCAVSVLENPETLHDSYYIHTCGKCLPVLRMLGRNADADRIDGAEYENH